MNPTAALSPRRVAPRRSVFITALGWVILLLSALLIPISTIALLMILAGSDGTASTDAVGFLSVVVAPPAAFVVGIGLLRRRDWAWYGALGLLVAVILLNVWTLATTRTTTTTHISPAGTRTTVLAAGSNHHSLPLIAISSLVIATLFLPSIRSELGASGRTSSQTIDGGGDHDPVGSILSSTPPHESVSPEARDWRVGHHGRDNLYYEEWQRGRWHRIEIDGEMLTGRAHHVIYFPAPERWQSYPEWARHRRSEIIERIKSTLQPPGYEYYDSSTNGPRTQLQQTAPPLPRPASPAPTSSDHRVLLLAIVLLLAVAGSSGWAVKYGIEQGTAVLWAKQARISASRNDEPATFWLAIGIQSTLAAGCGGLAFWLIFQGWRRGPAGR